MTFWYSVVLIAISIPFFVVYGENQTQEELLQKGIEHFSFDEYELAIKKFDQVLEINPNNVEALYNKGNTLSRLGKHIEAIPYFEKVLKLEPGKYIAQLKLENSLTQVSTYEFGYLDGVLEISVHDTQGNLVAFLRSTKIKAIEHEIVENLVEDWPTKKIVNKNTQKINIHQQEFLHYVENDSILGFHEIPFSEKVSLPLASTWHFQIPVEKGDKITYTYSIFRPVN